MQKVAKDRKAAEAEKTGLEKLLNALEDGELMREA